MVAALRAALPELSADDVPGLLEKAKAAKGIPLRTLADHLADHPDALVTGDPRCPVVAVRLTHVLHDAGYRPWSSRAAQAAARSHVTCRDPVRRVDSAKCVLCAPI